jgi:hypothetical protein
MALGSTQPLTETNTRDLPEGKGRRDHKADNLTAICEPIWSSDILNLVINHETSLKHVLDLSAQVLYP